MYTQNYLFFFFQIFLNNNHIISTTFSLSSFNLNNFGKTKYLYDFKCLVNRRLDISRFFKLILVKSFFEKSTIVFMCCKKNFNSCQIVFSRFTTILINVNLFPRSPQALMYHALLRI